VSGENYGMRCGAWNVQRATRRMERATDRLTSQIIVSGLFAGAKDIFYILLLLRHRLASPKPSETSDQTSDRSGNLRPFRKLPTRP
jgi:hypothetical protein